MKLGKTILAEGGVFDITFDASMRIEQVHIQKPSLTPYAQIYGDFTILERTFNISAHNLILMVFSNVDSLGKTTITGMTLAAAEPSHAAVKAAYLYNLNHQDSVLLTDGASAFSLTAAQLKQKHLLCLQYVFLLR